MRTIRIARTGWLWISLAVAAPSAWTSEVFQDWALTCSAKMGCALEQRLFLEGNDEAPLLQIAIRPLPDASQQFLAVIRVPLGVWLEPGLQLAVDQGQPRQVKFHHCRGEGCVVLFPLPADFVDTLRAGRRLHIALQLVDGQRVNLPVSLLGISAGLQALTRGR